MVDWVLTDDKLKAYPQFDAVISASEAMAYAKDPLRVSKHAFMPFIEYEVSWTRFAPAGETGKRKERRIRYASRRDSYIYSYYRHLLSELYEAKLVEHGLAESVLAYRRIPNGRGGGKCNVHFALDAFAAIECMGNCSVIALDISKFFEHLDHDLLKDNWRWLLGSSKLPPDHFAVFKNITNYGYVMKLDAYRRLGIFGPKSVRSDGSIVDGYLVHHRKIPRQLCNGQDFRSKIAPLIKRNHKRYGVPQGAPLSDLLANLYMFRFDLWLREEVTAVGGLYLRYSDDILIIVPGANKQKALRWMKRASSQIKRYGDRLEIKPEKATVHTVKVRKSGAVCTRVHGTQAKNGIEYLGFRFDGQRAYLRDSTLSNLQRKVVRVARAVAHRHVRRYGDRSVPELLSSFNYEGFISRFGKVEDFEDYVDDKRRWTFWTYATKAMKIAGPRGTPIRKQLRHYRDHLRRRVEREIVRAAGIARSDWVKAAA